MTGQGLADASTFFSYFLSVFIALGIVLLLAWITLRLLAGRMAGLGTGGKNIRVIETMPLGPKRSLHIVEVGEKVFLVGSSDGGITLLSELDRASLTIPEKPAPRPRLKFLDFLKKKS
jgi:flagellar biosynthetic protein FliO